MGLETKKTKILNLWLVGVMAILALLTFSCAGDDDDGDGELSSLNGPTLDVKYGDHGMVNVTGNTVTTKVRRILPTEWKSDVAFYDGLGGVRINDYMFSFDTEKLSVLTVRNITSGVTKDLSEKTAYYREIIKAELLMGRNIWTVLRGFTRNGTDEYGKAAYKESYRLVSRSFYGTMKYFEVNVTEAFEQGKELALSSIADVQFPTHDRLISLIRVPSLEPNPQSENFGCNDFAAVVYANHDNDRLLNTRYIQFDPYLVDINQPPQAWVYQAEIYRRSRWVGDLSNVSATTEINSDGNYCVVIAATSRDKQKVSVTAFESRYYSSVASNMATFGVKYDRGSQKYGLELLGQIKSFVWLDKNGTSYSPTFELSHNTFIASWGRAIAGQTYSFQDVGFLGLETRQSPEKKDYEAFIIRWIYSSDAIYDWSPAVLEKYGIDPKVDLSPAQKAIGEGSIVQGMVLSVPQNKGYKDKFEPIGEEVEKYCLVKFKQAITSTMSCGTRNTTGGGQELQLGGITKFPSFALNASSAWSYTQGTTKTTSLKYSSEWRLQDCRGNLIITLDPNITLRSAVLHGVRGHDRANVKYFNQPETDKAYVITTAVMGERVAFNYRYGITDQPGCDLNSPPNQDLKKLVLTQGMTPYRVDQTGTGSNYMNIIDSLKYFNGREAEGIIPRIAIGNNFVGSDAGSSSNVEISSQITAITESTQSWSSSMTVGMENIISVTAEVNGKFCVSASNTNERTVGWLVEYLKPLINEGVFKVLPDVYWIPTSKLKAKYGTREPAGLPENRNLKFIPDYMWSNNMDYWLLAYSDMQVEDF